MTGGQPSQPLIWIARRGRWRYCTDRSPQVATILSKNSIPQLPTKNQSLGPRPWSRGRTGAAPRERAARSAVRGLRRDPGLGQRPGVPRGWHPAGPTHASPPAIAGLRRTPPGSRTPRPLSRPWPAASERAGGGRRSAGRPALGGAGARERPLSFSCLLLTLPAPSPPPPPPPRGTPPPGSSPALGGRRNPRSRVAAPGPPGQRTPGRGRTPAAVAAPSRRDAAPLALPAAGGRPRRLPPRRIPGIAGDNRTFEGRPRRPGPRHLPPRPAGTAPSAAASLPPSLRPAARAASLTFAPLGLPRPATATAAIPGNPGSPGSQLHTLPRCPVYGRS